MFEIGYILIKVINARMCIDKNNNNLFKHFPLASFNIWEHQYVPEVRM